MPGFAPSSSCVPICHPWTLDSGIPAGMTALQHLCHDERSGLGTIHEKARFASAISRPVGERSRGIRPWLLAHRGPLGFGAGLPVPGMAVCSGRSRPASS